MTVPRLRWLLQLGRLVLAPVGPLVLVAAVLGLVVAGLPAERALLTVTGATTLAVLVVPDRIVALGRWTILVRWVLLDAPAGGLAEEIRMGRRTVRLVPLPLLSRTRDGRTVLVIRPLPGQGSTTLSAAADRLSIRWGRPVRIERRGSVLVVVAEPAT